MSSNKAIESIYARADMKIIKGNQKFRFLVHGDRAEVVEGHWSGDLVVIEFPDGVCARSWYASPAYQAILPLRVDNTEGDVVFVDAVSADHRATDVLVG
jgi:uncharacterized protein (DUF1330 family)